MPSEPMTNIMSIDVEDWFCVQNMAGTIPRGEWDRLESRVEANTIRLLDLFDRHRVEATFFVLGWVAERFPDLVREIDRRGHEVATHGYSHRMVTELTPEQFRADLSQSLEILAKASSQPVRGFRAPSFSVTRKTIWALDVMQQLGLSYDSSIFPIGFHPDYGIGDIQLTMHRTPQGLVELPMSCVEWLGKRIPCSGGGYFRLYPYAISRQLIRQCNRQGRPVVFYLHPWETDPGQPRVAMPALKRFRHYNNLSQTMDRMHALLTDFRFTSVRKLLAERVIQ